MSRRRCRMAPPDFVVSNRMFWRLRKVPGSAGMIFWLTEEPGGGSEGSELAFDIRTLPGWPGQSGAGYNDLDVGFDEYPAVLRDAMERGIDLTAHSAAAWRGRSTTAAGSTAADLDADIPF